MLFCSFGQPYDRGKVINKGIRSIIGIGYAVRVRQTTQNNVSIRFLTNSVEERINMSIDVLENTMEYFLKN